MTSADMETIFTPIITPVIKNRISPGSTGGASHPHEPTINTERSSQQRPTTASTSSGVPSTKTPSTTTTTMTASGTTSGRSNRPPSQIAGGSSGKSTTGPQGTTMRIIGTAVECTNVVTNQLWICPTCNKPDESVPMIGCDSCDDWYHW